MELDRALRDVESGRDLLVRIVEQERVENVLLAPGEARAPRGLGSRAPREEGVQEQREQDARDPVAPLRDRGQGGQELAARVRVGEQALDPGAQEREGEGLAQFLGQDDDEGSGRGVEQLVDQGGGGDRRIAGVDHAYRASGRLQAAGARSERIGEPDSIEGDAGLNEPPAQLLEHKLMRRKEIGVTNGCGYH